MIVLKHKETQLDRMGFKKPFLLDEFRVPPSFIDHYGHVNHERYHHLFEWQQQVYLSIRNASFMSEEASGRRYVQRNVELDFLAPMFKGQAVLLATKISEIKETSFVFEQRIHDASEPEINIAYCKTVYVSINEKGFKHPIRPEYRKKLKQHKENV